MYICIYIYIDVLVSQVHGPIFAQELLSSDRVIRRPAILEEEEAQAITAAGNAQRFGSFKTKK